VGYGVPESGASFTPSGYGELNAKTFIATPAEIQTESGLPHCIPGKNANRILGKVLHTLQSYELNRRQDFAYSAFSRPESGEDFTDPAKLQTEFHA